MFWFSPACLFLESLSPVKLSLLFSPLLICRNNNITENKMTETLWLSVSCWKNCNSRFVLVDLSCKMLLYLYMHSNSLIFMIKSTYNSSSTIEQRLSRKEIKQIFPGETQCLHPVGVVNTNSLDNFSLCFVCKAKTATATSCFSVLFSYFCSIWFQYTGLHMKQRFWRLFQICLIW